MPLGETDPRTFWMRIIAPFLQLYSAMPPAHAKLLAALGIREQQLQDRELRIPIHRAPMFWQAMAELTGDPCIGLHSAAVAPFGTFGVSDYLTASAQTMLDALRLLTKYIQIVDERWELVLTEREDGLRIEDPNTTNPFYDPHARDFGISVIIQRMRQFSGRTGFVRRVRIVHQPLVDAAEYERVLGAPVEFGQASYVIECDPKIAGAALVQADPRLAEVMQREADKLLAMLGPRGREHRVLDEVRGFIREHLADGNATLAKAAPALGMSSRTLQRRLAELDQSFADLVADVRRELASDLVLDAELSSTEIAFLLGYSDAVAFQRAFKRWFGEPPLRYRDAHS